MTPTTSPPRASAPESSSASPLPARAARNSGRTEGPSRRRRLAAPPASSTSDSSSARSTGRRGVSPPLHDAPRCSPASRPVPRPARTSSPSYRHTSTAHAPKSRMALSAIASKTGCTSVCAWLMARRMSAVAVCRSSASPRSLLRASSSLNRRTFSMAITAWSAKVWSSAICLSENGSASRGEPRSRRPRRPRAAAARRGRLRKPPAGPRSLAELAPGLCAMSADVHRLAVDRSRGPTRSSRAVGSAHRSGTLDGGRRWSRPARAASRPRTRTHAGSRAAEPDRAVGRWRRRPAARRSARSR